MTEHDVLVATKSYLLNHGWHQGHYGAPGGSRCLLGAMGSVCGLKSSESDAFDDEDRPQVMIDAARLLMKRLGVGIWIWNDTQGRTLDDVIGALDEAIVATAPVETAEPVEALA